MHVAGVDGRHDKGRRPGAHVLVEQRLVAARLFRTVEPRRQDEGILHHRDQAEILRHGRERRPRACCGAAGERAFHGADAALDPRDRRAELLLRRLLHEVNAELERNRVETAGEQDPRAARFRRRLMRVDHLAHPQRLAAEIEIVGPRGGTGRDQFRAVELIWADGRDDQPGLRDHRLQRGGIAGIGDDQRGVIGCPDRVAHRGELVPAAAGHRPFQTAIALVLSNEILGDQLAGKTGGAIDDDVKFRRH